MKRGTFIRLQLILTIIAAFLCILGTTRVFSQPAELLIGIEPEHNIFDQVENYRRLADYLSGKTGVMIKVTIMSRYGEVLQRFKARELDGAFLSSYTSAMAIKSLGLEPVARQVNLHGSSVTRGLIFTRQDSGIEEISDMRGKNFAFVDPATAEGYLFPQAFLRENGINDPKNFLGYYFFTGSHTSTISAVLDGRADLGASKDTIYDRQISRDPTIIKELKVLAKSQPLPETTLCLKHDLPSELKENLVAVLLNMSDNEHGKQILGSIGATRFSSAGVPDYDIVFNLGEKAGIAMPTSNTE